MKFFSDLGQKLSPKLHSISKSVKEGSNKLGSKMKDFSKMLNPQFGNMYKNSVTGLKKVV